MQNTSDIKHVSPNSNVQATKIDESAALSWRPNHGESARSYHKVHDSGYMLPSDEIEQRRLEMQNKMLRLAFGHDVICPEAQSLIKSESVKILDVGCANGAWMDTLFVDHNAKCQFHGADIAEDAFKRGTKCQAKIIYANALEGLPYPDNTFDYVHQRLLVGGIPKDKWAKEIKELARVTKPGGWIELVETNILRGDRNGPDTKAFAVPAALAFEKRGLDPDSGTNLPGYVKAAGNLTNVQVKPVKIPLGWGGELGRIASDDISQVFSSLADWLTKAFGVTTEEYLEMINKMQNEWPEQETYIDFQAVWAQKVDTALPPSRATPGSS